MKRILLISALFFFYVTSANATSITTSATGNYFGDSYGFEFTIDDSYNDYYHATLTNTSSNSLSDALIDVIAFNLSQDLELGVDFEIINVQPEWVFEAVPSDIDSNNGGGIQFGYVGERTTPQTRLEPTEVLSFDFNFLAYTPDPLDPFALWTDAAGTRGTGLGGGDDFGQVAVSFQQLGVRGDDSDLLASNWSNSSNPVPEPATMFLLGSGLLGLGWTRRKKKNS